MQLRDKSEAAPMLLRSSLLWQMLNQETGKLEHP